MIGYRITVVVLLALLTACMTCSSLFPLFRRTTQGTVGGVSRRTAYYYWYVESATLPVDKVWTTRRLYTRDILCDRMRTFYVWASALAVAAAGLGALATVLGAAWVSVGRGVCLGVVVFMLSFVAFACSGAALGLTSYAYCSAFCGDNGDAAMTAPRDAAFDLVEGFILLCVATGGLLVVTLTQAIGLCCGCQCGTAPARRTSHEMSREPVEGAVRGRREATRPRVVVGRDASRTYATAAVPAVPASVSGSAGSTEGLYPYPVKS